LAFILCGVTAFAYGGNFGSVVNSVFPIGSGMLVGQQKPADPED